MPSPLAAGLTHTTRLKQNFFHSRTRTRTRNLWSPIMKRRIRSLSAMAGLMFAMCLSTGVNLQTAAAGGPSVDSVLGIDQPDCCHVIDLLARIELADSPDMPGPWALMSSADCQPLATWNCWKSTWCAMELSVKVPSSKSASATPADAPSRIFRSPWSGSWNGSLSTRPAGRFVSPVSTQVKRSVLRSSCPLAA